MKDQDPNQRPAALRNRRAAGRIAPMTLAVLLGFALCAGVVGYLLLDPFNTSGNEDETNRPGPSAEDLAAELGGLQQAFQGAMQERRDLARIEARVRDFTRRHPDQNAGHVLLAQVQMRRSKWGAAYTALGRALAGGPDTQELHKMAGACAAKLGRLLEAEQHYRDAVRVAGGAADSGVYASLGQIYLAMNNDSAAEQAFKQALKAPGPGEAENYMHEARSGLADVASLRGDFETAHGEIDRAIRLGRADSKADLTAYHIQKARLYMDADRDDQAVTMLSHTWNEFPDARWRIESARLRARLYERADELDKAVNHVTLVCDFHQRDPERQDQEVADFIALLAGWQIKAGQTEPASVSLHNLETLAPEHPALAELRKQMN